MLSYIFVTMIAAGNLFGASDTKTVNCKQGKKIQEAIDSLSEGKDTTIQISGTCNENILIDRFGGRSLTLAGTPGASINQ